jgi:hypothetical protein
MVAAVNSWVTSLKVAQDCTPKFTMYLFVFSHIDLLLFLNKKASYTKILSVWGIYFLKPDQLR